jgi:rod shape-determining protein MreB
MLAFMKQFVGSIFSKDLGIDLGTCNTLVYVRGKGIVLSEPSVVAVNKLTNKVAMDGAAVGVVAKEMIGKTMEKVVAIRPMKDGVVTDFDVTSDMINYFIKKVHSHTFGVMPRVVIAVPSGITKVEKRAVVAAAERAGARRVFLIEEPVAAAIGAGLPILDPIGSMIVDIGGGTAEIAILSCGIINGSKSVRMAGDEFDKAIIAHIKGKYGLMIGEQTAERIKVEIGSVMPLQEEQGMTVRGLDVGTRMPREVSINSKEVRVALMGPVSQIIGGIREVLDRTLPEIAADLLSTGITLAGGGSQLRGIDRLIGKEINIPVKVAEDPMTCVARGTGAIIENLDRFKVTLESDEDIN